MMTDPMKHWGCFFPLNYSCAYAQSGDRLVVDVTSLLTSSDTREVLINTMGLVPMIDVTFLLSDQIKTKALGPV